MGDEFPISITAEGMQLTNRGPKELEYTVTNERISSGLPRLDHMLNGGYYRGSIVLISGAPGTAKSTLSGLFAVAACKRGERTLYVSAERVFARHADSIALLVTDVVMPGCGGPELLGRLQQRVPALRVLYMSGYTEQSAAHRAGIDRGAPFVQKPFTAAELARRVREALDR